MLGTNREPPTEFDQGRRTLSVSRDDSPSDQFWLPPWIYTCSTAHGAVFLDARRNHYFGMGLDDTRALLRLLRDPPVSLAPCDAASVQIDDASLRDLANELIAGGVLCREPPTDGRGERTHLSLDGRLYSVGQEVEVPANARPIHVMHLVAACIRAKRDMRFRSIDAIAQDLRRRKAALRREGSHKDDIVRLVSIFRQLRPYLFHARDHCLFHALSLVRFLLAFDAPATWVIGVKTKPWGAHSWAQYEDLILDSSPERVVEYTPLLAA